MGSFFFMGSSDNWHAPLSIEQKKSRTHCCIRDSKKRQRPTLPLGIAVPSALMSLTSLFGMEKGGPHRHDHLKSW